jgi:hypothetical protein
MSTKINIQYFPFCPGIPWKIKNRNFVIPELNHNNWIRVHQNRQIAILSYGGLIESFYSFFIVEALHALMPEKKIYWFGNDSFNQLSYLTGITTNINKPLINKNIVKKYPLPIFLDKKKLTYYNCLNNYIDVFKLTKTYGYHDKRALIKQIFEKSCLKWNNNYIPKLRILREPNEFKNFTLSKKFNFKNPFVVIVPERTNWSEHDVSTLNWSVQEVKSFTSMLQQSGINTVIITKHAEKYFGFRALVLDPKLDQLFWLLTKAKAVLSKDIDILFISSVISNSRVIALQTKNEYSFSKHMKFFETKMKISLFKKQFTPFEAFREVHNE